MMSINHQNSADESIIYVESTLDELTCCHLPNTYDVHESSKLSEIKRSELDVEQLLTTLEQFLSPFEQFLSPFEITRDAKDVLYCLS